MILHSDSRCCLFLVMFYPNWFNFLKQFEGWLLSWHVLTNIRIFNKVNRLSASCQSIPKLVLYALMHDLCTFYHSELTWISSEKFKMHCKFTIHYDIVIYSYSHNICHLNGHSCLQLTKLPLIAMLRTVLHKHVVLIEFNKRLESLWTHHALVTRTTVMIFKMGQAEIGLLLYLTTWCGLPERRRECRDWGDQADTGNEAKHLAEESLRQLERRKVMKPKWAWVWAQICTRAENQL